MHVAIFTVLTDCALLLGSIVAFIVWANAGFPFVTITRR